MVSSETRAARPAFAWLDEHRIKLCPNLIRPQFTVTKQRSPTSSAMTISLRSEMICLLISPLLLLVGCGAKDRSGHEKFTETHRTQSFGVRVHDLTFELWNARRHDGPNFTYTEIPQLKLCIEKARKLTGTSVTKELKPGVKHRLASTEYCGAYFITPGMVHFQEEYYLHGTKIDNPSTHGHSVLVESSEFNELDQILDNAPNWRLEAKAAEEKKQDQINLAKQTLEEAS